MEVGLRRTGTLVVARDDDEAGELERQLAFRELAGAARDAYARERGARARAGAGPDRALAFEAPDDHAVDPRIVLAALRRACVPSGVELHEHGGALGVELDANETRGVGVRAARDGEQVWRGCGWRGASESDFGEGGAFDVAYAREWSWRRVRGAARWGLPERAKVPVRPVKGQILRVRDPAGPGLLERVVRFHGGYLVPRGDGRYVPGATMEERGFELVRDGGRGVRVAARRPRARAGVERAARSRSWASGYARAPPTTLPVIGPGSDRRG